MDINDLTGTPAPQNGGPQFFEPAQPQAEGPQFFPPAQPPQEEQPPVKVKKEKTVKQQLTSFGVGMVVLCFVLSFIAGAGGAFTMYRFYPLLTGEKETSGAEITEGEFHNLPDPTGTPDGTNAQQNADDPAVDEPAADEPASAEEPVTETPVPVAKTKGEIYAESVDSIVGIRAACQRQVQTFFGMYTTQNYTSTGSGFFVTEDGYIVTNYHVIENASQITVSTFDGNAYTAEVRGYEEANDLAVLKVTGEFTPVRMGSSAALSVGDDILVIGNPLGSLSYTFTDGVVSYLNRMITGDSGATIHMFQTNAAINEGNSGGPVYNMDGEVVGIASAKYASSDIEGLGFCIPIDDVSGMIQDIITTGHVTGKPVLGVSVQTVTEAMAARYGISVGCYVVAVGEGTAADAAGILTADVITAIDDVTVTTAAEMSYALSRRSAGDTVTVRVSRSGSDLIYTVTLDEYVPGEARTSYSNVYDF